MENAIETNHHLRFKNFELDLLTRELSRNGLRLKLQGQPIDVLQMLLEKPGALVTREQLQNKLWPQDTFVDFEHSLNSTIARLRDALGDRAEHPRFIETLPKLGYRFIAPVEPVLNETPDLTPPVALSGRTEAAASEADVVRGGDGAQTFDSCKSSERSKSARQEPRMRRSVLVLSGAALLVIVAAASLWFGLPVKPPVVLGITQITADGRAKGGVLLADSTRLYFSELIDGHYRLAEISIAGGEPEIIPSPFTDTWAVDVAPDGSSLLVLNATEGEDPALWILPLPAGPLRRVGNVFARAAAWSPEGDRIGYALDSKPEVYISKPDGSEAVRVGVLPQSVGSPEMAFSPDGAWVHVTEPTSDNRSEIWELPTAGGKPSPLVKTETEDDAARYTQDGRYIFYQHHEPGALNIWVTSSPHLHWWSRRLRHAVRITSGPLAFAEPVPSRDGRHVFALGSTFRSELLRYDSHLGRFMPFLKGLSAGQLASSPDGNWIAYVSYPESALWRSKPDGSNRLQLSSPGYNASAPAWSPDSKRIAFNKTCRGEPFQIMVVSVDGGTPEKLVTGTHVSDDQVLDPSWSVDGKRIAYTSSRTTGTDPHTFSIREVDVSSHQTEEVPGSRGLSQPTWSPDGTRLLAVTALGDMILSCDLRTKKWSVLAKGSNLGSLTWSQNGRYLQFEGMLGKESVLMRIPAYGGKPRMIAGLSDIPRAQWCNLVACPGTWSGQLGTEPIVQRDLSTQEIYRIDLRFP